MKLGQKLILFAIVCSVIPLIGMGTLAFDAARASLRNIVGNDLQSIANQERDDLQNYLQSAQGHLTTWGSLGIMQDVLVDDMEGDLRKELLRLSEQYPMFAELLVVNSLGLVVANTGPESFDQNFHNHFHYNAPAPGIEYQGLIRNSKRLSKRTIMFGIPIRANFDKETIIGSLVGSLDWEHVGASLAARSVFGGQQDQQRLIVVQSRMDKSILYSTNEKQFSDEFLESMTSNIGVIERKIDEGNYVVASSLSTESKTLRNPHWTVHVALDEDLAYSSVTSLLKYMLAVGVIAFFLVSALGYFLARTAVKPINALVLGAKGLASGDYNTPMPEYTHNDEIGDLTNSFLSMRDAIKNNEQELIKRTEISEEAARLKGEFLANMSHEVRTPINGVLGMTELLMNTDLDGTQSRYASTIFRSGQSLLSVINDILDFSKIEAGKLELQDSAFDLREVVEDVVELVAESAHKKNIEISATLTPEAHVAYQGDASRVRQVLINLLGNAVKFTTEGEVKLCVSCEDNGESSSLLRFEVTDTGIGISPKAQSSIFESFVQADGTTTRKYGGTGLGLAISAQLAELMHGDIGVKSEPGVGSTFWFTAAVGKLPTTVENAWQDSTSLAGKRILIVDDNKTNREILQAQVAFWGADYVLTEGGEEALSALRTACDANNPFDLAILDMHMPGMDGLALTVAIKEEDMFSKTRLVLLSSVCDELDVASYRAIGLESVLTKPVRQPELFQCLTAVMANTKIEPKPSTQVHKLDFSQLSGRILIAEDNPVNQELIAEIIGLMGIDFQLVGNGQEALDALLQERFDAVLMDCQMPILDGFEATRKIRAREKAEGSNSPVPIIALTANALQGDREKCLDCGMDEYLTKPVSSRQVHEMLSRWLNEKNDELVQEDLAADLSSSGAATDLNNIVVLDGVEKNQEELEVAALDPGAFSEIMAISAQASLGFLARLTQKFVDNSANDIEKLEVSLGNAQSEDIRQFAHSLKSSSANLGAKYLAELCQVIESASAEQKLDGMEEQLLAIKLERIRVIDALNNECQKAA